MREECIALEDHAETALLRLQLIDAVAAEADLAARKRKQPRDTIESRRFAAAGGAEQGDEFARLDRQVDAVERVVSPEGPAQAIEFETGICCAKTALCS